MIRRIHLENTVKYYDSIRKTLTTPQATIFFDNTRFIVCCAGRRFGKTTLAITLLIHKSIAKTQQNSWYIAPTYSLAKEVVWKVLKNTLFGMKIKFKSNETTLTLTILKTQSTITLKGGAEPDLLRGRGLDYAVLDEFATMNFATWTDALRPSLSDKNGKCLFIGSPQGFNALYTLFLLGQDNSNTEWKSYQFTTAQGGNVSAEELEKAKKDLCPKKYKQEYEASFETISQRVYYAFERRLMLIEYDYRQHLSPNAEVLIGMDFNCSPMSAVCGIISNGTLIVIEEIYLNDSNTAEMIVEINRIFPTQDIKVFPDASGNQRSVLGHENNTSHQLLREAGFSVYVNSVNPRVEDRIECVNTLFKNARGDFRCYVAEHCVNLIKCLEGLTYKEGSNSQDKSLGLDHLPDALGYLIYHEFPIISTTPQIGKILVSGRFV